VSYPLTPLSTCRQWRTQRCGTAMARGKVQCQRGLVVRVEISLVHRHQDVPPLADLMHHPAGKAVPHIDAVVSEQPVDLLDCVLGDQAASLGERLTDHRYRQRGGLHHTQCRVGQ